MSIHRLCSVGDLAPGTAASFGVDRHRICLVRIDDDYYAIGDVCTHADVSLAEGEVDVDDKHIECWKHGSRFSLETGVPDTLPATRREPVYRVKVEGDDVLVEIA